MCVTHAPALSENIWNLLQTFTAKNHHFSLLRSVLLLLLLLCASPRLSSSRIRAGRSCKCAAGGRSSIKLSAGEKISWCAGKTTQLREKRACHVPAPQHPTPNTIAFPLTPPCTDTDRKGKAISPFIGSCSARMMSIRELSRECMFRLSYILVRSWKKRQVRSLISDKTNTRFSHAFVIWLTNNKASKCVGIWLNM